MAAEMAADDSIIDVLSADLSAVLTKAPAVEICQFATNEEIIEVVIASDVNKLNQLEDVLEKLVKKIINRKKEEIEEGFLLTFI